MLLDALFLEVPCSLSPLTPLPFVRTNSNAFAVFCSGSFRRTRLWVSVGAAWETGHVRLYPGLCGGAAPAQTGEADRIVTLLTRQHGLVRAVAKGVRRTKSKFGARLEPFAHIDVQLHPGRNLDIVTQVSTASTRSAPTSSTTTAATPPRARSSRPRSGCR